MLGWPKSDIKTLHIGRRANFYATCFHSLTAPFEFVGLFLSPRITQAKQDFWVEHPDPGLGWPPEAVEGRLRPNFFLAQMIPFDPSVNP